MYNEYFGFNQSPFSIAPDPYFLYMGDSHRDALAHLLYGIENNGGIVLLTGEVGTGKTTLCRCLIEQIPENTRIAYIINPPQTPKALLITLCQEFDLSVEPSMDDSELLQRINAFLLDGHEKDEKVVLVVDEAQNLSVEILEQLRLLTNLETTEKKLLQILLLGQPELHHKLSMPALRQLGQRVTARFVLRPLTIEETADYVEHRLQVAGGTAELIPRSIIRRIWRLSGGIPRIINLLIDRSLLGAYAEGKKRIDRKILTEASGEIFSVRQDSSRRFSLMSLLVAAGLCVITALFLWRNQASAPVLSTSVEQPPALSVPTGSPEMRLPPADREELGSEVTSLPSFSDRDLALAALLRHWTKTSVPADADVCASAVLQGLECFATRGNWGTLRRFNRPAVVQLIGSGALPEFALILSLDGNEVTLSGTEGQGRVTREDFEDRWDGEFTIFWRKPVGYQGQILESASSSPLVPWLDTALAALYQIPKVSNPSGGQHYTADLEARVRRFQSERGLLVDGKVGRKTLIAINSAIHADIPKLTP